MNTLEKMLASTDDNGVREQAAEMSTNWKRALIDVDKLVQKIEVIQVSERLANADVADLQRRCDKHESADREKIGTLRNRIEVMDLKLLSLTSQLEDSAPKEEFQHLQSQYNALLSKSQQQTERERELILASQETAKLQRDLVRQTILLEEEQAKLKVAVQREANYKKLLDDRCMLEVDDDVIALKTRVATLNAQKKNLELDLQNAQTDATSGGDRWKETLQGQLKDNQNEVVRLLGEMEKANLKVDAIERKFGGGLERKDADKLRERNRELEDQAHEVSVSTAQHRFMAEMAKSQAKDANVTVENLREQTRSNEEFVKTFGSNQSAGDLEAGLARLQIEATRLRVREKATARRLEAAEDQISHFEEGTENLQELLDSKRLTVFSLQNLLRNAKQRARKEITLLRGEVHGRPTQDQGRAWLESLHKMAGLKSEAERELSETKGVMSALEGEIALQRDASDAQSELVKALQGSGSERDKVEQLTSQVMKLSIKENQYRRIEGRLTKKVEYLTEIHNENDETIQSLEKEIGERMEEMQLVKDEMAELRYDAKVQRENALQLEILKGDSQAEAASQARANRILSQFSGGDYVTQDETPAPPHGKPKPAFLHLDNLDGKELLDPANPDKRAKQKFVESFLSDVAKSLGIPRECLTMDPEEDLQAGSVKASFHILDSVDTKAKEIRSNLLAQLKDRDSAIFQGELTRHTNADKTHKVFEEILRREEDEDDDEDPGVTVSQQGAAKLGNQAPGRGQQQGNVMNTKEFSQLRAKFDEATKENTKFVNELKELRDKETRLNKRLNQEKLKVKNAQQQLDAVERLHEDSISGGLKGDSASAAMAAEAIMDLQERLSKKDEQVKMLQKLTDDTRNEVLIQQDQYEVRISNLMERINQFDEMGVRQLTEDLHRLDVNNNDVPPGSPTKTGGVDVEALMAEKDKRLGLLQRELERVEDECDEYQGLLKEREEEIDELKFEVDALKSRPTVDPSAHAKESSSRPSKGRSGDAEAYRKEIMKLKEANKLLQARLLEAAEAAARGQSEPQDAMQRKMVEEATSLMEQRLQKLTVRGQRLREETEKGRQERDELIKQHKVMQQKNAALESAVRRLKAELSSRGGGDSPVDMETRLEETTNKLRDQDRKMATMRSQMNDLKADNKKKEEEITKAVNRKAGSLPASGVSKDVKDSSEARSEWNRGKQLEDKIKKWEAKCEQYKKQLEKVTKEAEQLRKSSKEHEAKEAALEKSLAAKTGRAGAGIKGSTGSGARVSLAELGSVVSLKEENYGLVKEEKKLQAQLEEKRVELGQRDAAVRRVQERLELAEACGGMLGGEPGGGMERRYSEELSTMEKEFQKQAQELTELTLQKNEASMMVEPMRRRIEQLEDLVLVLQEQEGSRQQAHAQLGAAGKGKSKEGGSVPVKDLEQVIEGLTELVATTQAENEQLKRSGKKEGHELRSWKKKAEAMEAELSESRSKVAAADDLQGRITKLNDIGVRTARQLKKQTETTEKLRALVSELNDHKARLEGEMKGMEEQLSAATRDHSTVAATNHEFDREKKLLEDSMITLNDKNKRLESQLERWRKELTEARAELDEAQYSIEKLQGRESQLQRELSGLRAGQSEMDGLGDEVQNLKQLAKQLQEENVRLLRKQGGGGGGGNAGGSEEIGKLEQENRDLRAELASFDPAFWDEIEDLKYREHESKNLCRKYERMLREASETYGFPFTGVRRSRD